MIYGNTKGVRATLLSHLESLYDLETEADVFVSPDILAVLAECSCEINREISLYISRGGSILDISIGDSATVGLRDTHLKRNKQRLSCVRCIHTHPGGDGSLSELDLNSLKSMRFDAMAALGVQNKKPVNMQAAFLVGPGQDPQIKLTSLIPANRIPQRDWIDQISEADAQMKTLASSVFTTGSEPERAFLVGIDTERSLDELKGLAQSAGAVVVGKMLQNKDRPDRVTFIGSGKTEELCHACQVAQADLVVFDDELSGMQIRNLEKLLGGVRILDRTALILDIFAQRAESREGRLQVELAQLSYQLPRLSGHGIAMSRLGGGIGTRGPGETRLELDKRLVRRRMHDLTAESNMLQTQRDLQRKKRKKNDVPIVALVGYTNAGKTTLLNALSGAEARAEDRLFATLDPLVRTITLPSGMKCLLADTVGFVNKLPHALIDAFRSTLEEAVQADVLVMVSDGTSPEFLHHRDVVLKVLEELKVSEKPRIEIISKADKLEGRPEIPNALLISATHGEGIDALLSEIEKKLEIQTGEYSVLIPYEKGNTISRIYSSTAVNGVEYRNDGTLFRIKCSTAFINELEGQLGENAISRPGIISEIKEESV